MERERKWHGSKDLFQAVTVWAKPLCIQEAKYTMDARYYDTAEGFLSAHHAGLRIRVENGASVCCLKCGGHVNGAEHLREEYECPADSIITGLQGLMSVGAPYSLCQELIQKGVMEVCRVLFTRYAYTVQDGEMTAELALDSGILLHGEVTAPLCEIELEHKKGEESAFQQTAKRLENAFGLIPEPRSKLARALSLC